MESALHPPGIDSDLEEILDSIALALVIVDGHGRIVYANRYLEILLGCSRTDLPGRGLEELIPELRIQTIPVSELPRRLDASGIRQDGTRIPLEVALSRLHRNSGDRVLATLTDIRARRRAEAVEQQMTAIVESAQDAILTKDLDGIIRSWNAGAERLLGFRAEEAIGGPITRLIPPELQNEEIMILDQLRRGLRISEFETIRRRRDGTDVHVSLTISPIRDRSGVVVGASKIMRDISRRKRNEENLRRSNAELARINKELDEFVYTASHDLRSPLTNIGSVVQWIVDDDETLCSETRDRLALIQRRIERMKRLLSDIRDYARSGNTEDIAGPACSVSSIVAEVIDSLYIPGGFQVKCDPRLDTILVGHNPIAQVFHNLIGNAVKHHDGQSGSVQVSIDTTRPMWRFLVSDDGPGIGTEYREEIFNMFKTLKPRDEVEGSGMGLALVRKIVTRMGGDCGVESNLTRGARFWFDWPRLAPNPERRP